MLPPPARRHERGNQMEEKTAAAGLVLDMQEITKRFPGVVALDKVSLTLKRGEVHALVGENGAGKSTMMKVLLGMYKPDGGKIIYKGQEVHFASPADALNAGISMIHQEISLIPTLSVAENIWIGREEKFGSLGFVNPTARGKAADELLARYGIELDSKKVVASLSVAQMQIVELMRAISYNAEIIIMDEPTSALSNEEIKKLYEIVGELKAAGTTIVFISHKLDEIFAICDRITVMRDGRGIGTYDIGEMDNRKLISLIAGRELSNTIPKTEPEIGEVIFECKHLSSPNGTKDVSFQLRKGEILGFAGLMGAGRTEIMRAIFGIDKLSGGEIYLEGNKVNLSSPQKAVKRGLGMITEDRLRMGILANLSVKFNTSIAYLYNHCRFLGFLKMKQEKADAAKVTKDLGTKTAGLDQRIADLSGGNQQKVIIGRWLMTNPKILIMDEPTRGIDVGAKSEIYRLMDDLVHQGMSIIMVSSEMYEVMGMSDRILVVRGGSIVAEYSREEAEQETIMRAAFGVTE